MYRLADNKVAEKSGWDFDRLDELLEEVEADFDIGDFGFDLDRWGESEEDEIVERDKASEEGGGSGDGPVEPALFDPERRVSQGDVVRMGPHILVCGMPNEDDFARLGIGDAFAIATSSAGMPADIVAEMTRGAGAFVLFGDDPVFAPDLFSQGWPVEDFLQWERPAIPDAEDGRIAHEMATVAVVGVSPDPETVGHGVCREDQLAGLLSWIVSACTSEGDTVLDLTECERNLVSVCDSLGRRCVSWCSVPEACDVVLADWEESHRGETAEITHLDG